jgi:hypothetical protein
MGKIRKFYEKYENIWGKTWRKYEFRSGMTSFRHKQMRQTWSEPGRRRHIGKSGVNTSFSAENEKRPLRHGALLPADL